METGESYVAVLDTTKNPIEDLYRGHIIINGIDKSEEEIQRETNHAYAPFQQALLEEIESVTQLEPVLITGQDAVDNAQRKGLRMHNTPLTILGQSFYRDILTQTGELWDAYNIHVSRLYLPTVSNTPVGYIPQRNHPPLREQTQQIAGNVLAAGKETVILADDNASMKASTFSSTAARFEQHGVKTEAYIAGFYAGSEYDHFGNRTQINGVPIYAVRSRFSTPDDIQKAKNGELAVPASIETIDTLYLPSSGIALPAGFPETQDTIFYLKNYLQGYKEILQGGNHPSGDTVQRDLERLGVEVRDSALLVNYLETHADTDINIPQLIELLAESESEQSILHIPQFHILKPDPRRIPHIWPGDKEQQSFWNHMTVNTWKLFSSRMQTVTIDLLSSLENASGHEIPSSLFPFLALPEVKKYFSEGVPPRAIDAIYSLRRTLLRDMYQLKF